MEKFVVELQAGATYLPVRAMPERYNIGRAGIYEIMKQIEACPRYKGVWICIGGERGKLVNTLVFEDFLRYRKQLRNPNMAKRLPPYNPEEVRRQRGELKAVMDFMAPMAPDPEEIKEMVREILMESLSGQITAKKGKKAG